MLNQSIYFNEELHICIGNMKGIQPLNTDDAAIVFTFRIFVV